MTIRTQGQGQEQRDRDKDRGTCRGNSDQSTVVQARALSLIPSAGFLSAFCPSGGGQNEIVWITGGGASTYLFVCKACGKLGGSGGMLPQENFDFGLFIGRNLVESGTVFAQT